MIKTKTSAFLLIVVVSCGMAGLYGILHDQLTYTISPEYYTKFKFYQFNLSVLGDEAIFPNPRIEVSIVGFLATWWVGLFIGLILGLVGLIHHNAKLMFFITFRALLLTLLVAFITGLYGLIYGKFFLEHAGSNWYLPENLVDHKNFIAVGCMHNHSYLGGLIGLFVGIVYSIIKRKKQVSV